MTILSRHTDISYNLFADKGIQMGDMSGHAWLIGFNKHAIWATYLHILYLLLLSVLQILASSELTLWPSWQAK
jgi:hypothetical protein